MPSSPRWIDDKYCQATSIILLVATFYLLYVCSSCERNVELDHSSPSVFLSLSFQPHWPLNQLSPERLGKILSGKNSVRIKSLVLPSSLRNWPCEHMAVWVIQDIEIPLRVHIIQFMLYTLWEIHRFSRLWTSLSAGHCIGCVHMSIHEYFTVSQKCISHELLLLSKTIYTRVLFVYFLAFKLLQYDKLGFQACVYFGRNKNFFFARIVL